MLPTIDFPRAVQVMSTRYQAFFRRAYHHFGREDQEYRERLAQIRDELRDQNIVRSLREDPWAFQDATGEAEITTIDVLVMFTPALRAYYEERGTHTIDRLRTEEMFANITFFQSNLDVRFRFKMLPFRAGPDNEPHLSAELYRSLRDAPEAPLNGLISKDKDLSNSREHWGADLLLLCVAKEERIFAAGIPDGCGTTVWRGNPRLNHCAVARVCDDGFCADLWTSCHELIHLFGVDHPTEEHEKEVNDGDFTYRFSMMGYRDGLCKDRKAKCLRTLSLIPSVRAQIQSRAAALAAIAQPKEWL